MALNISEKKDVVKEVSEIASSAQAAVAAEYRGLTVQELSELRSNARNLGVYVKVIKNSLAKIAIKDTNFECMDPSLKGPLIFAFSKEGIIMHWGCLNLPQPSIPKQMQFKAHEIV